MTYDDFKKQIEDQYKDYEQLPSFLKSETAGQRARKTYEAYENLTIAKSLTVQPSLGLESLLKSPIIILSTFLFLLYLLMNCIFVEREEHQLIYAASTINGKRKLYFSKYTALSFLTILFYVLQFVFAFLFSNIYFGHIDLSVPVQSLSFAQGCPYSINCFYIFGFIFGNGYYFLVCLQRFSFCFVRPFETNAFCNRSHSNFFKY